MRRGLEAQVCGLEQILLFTVLIVAGLLPTVRSVWGEDDTVLPIPLQSVTTKAAAADVEHNVDQIHAQFRLLSVPTELVESTISDWILAPLDQKQVAAADPFSTMNQPLQRPHTKSGSDAIGQAAVGTEMRIPNTHKILNNQEAQQLLSRLETDARTRMVFSPQLAFIDGITATAVNGQKTMFVVGWKDGLPQTRAVSQGKMLRLRTVLDDDKIWLDYEIIVSRILDVTTQSIRIVNHSQPIALAVPNVQTTKAAATVELPVGGTVLIGGLPAESQDGIPRQLIGLLRVGQVSGRLSIQTAKSNPPKFQWKAAGPVIDAVPVQTEPQRLLTKPKKRNPFSLISRILNRAPRQAADPVEEPVENNLPDARE